MSHASSLTRFSPSGSGMPRPNPFKKGKMPGKMPGGKGKMPC